MIAISGASGFTGERVVHRLSARYPDATLRCLVRASSNTESLSALGGRCVTGDLRDTASLDRLLEGAEVYVHVASLGFDWTEQVLRAVQVHRVPRSVFFSTTAIFTRLPVRSQSVREQSEAMIRGSDTKWTILRPTMIYGSARDRNVSRLIRFVRRTPVIPIVAPESLQQPVHVDDIAAAVIGVLDHEQTYGRAYNLSGARALTLGEMFRAVAQALRVRRLFVTVPYSTAIAGVTFYNHVARRAIITVEQVERIRENKDFTHDEAARDFGFVARTFQQGVHEQVAAMMSLVTGTKE